MSLRTRPVSRPRRVRLRRVFEGEERQQFLVTLLFAAVIVAVVAILAGAVALAWYNDNLRPLARVGPVEIGPPFLRDRLGLELWRIERDENRLTQARIEGLIDSTTAAARQSALDERSQALQTTGLEDLIDLLYQSQLAGNEGIAVSDEEVDQRAQAELDGVERRHVLAIFVQPQAADAEAGPTNTERRAALDRAEEALAAIQSGREWADVAREFSTDASGPNGGDYGIVSESAVIDEEWGRQLFELEQGGTTEIVRGDDGTYRIGRVVEVLSAGEDPALRESLLEDINEERFRELLRYEITADRLEEKVVSDALAQAPEQARISVILLAGLPTGDPEEAEGEVDYSEIVFAPGNDLETAPDLPADDPAWQTALTDAQTNFDELKAITDLQAMEIRFAAMATAISDSPTREDGGRVDFVTRSIPPTAVADALFDSEHQPGALIGPIRGDAAYYVLLFHERRGSPEQRIVAVEAALAQPGADFAALAREHSDGPEAAEGGVVGWVTRDQLSEEFAEPVFALAPGGISEPLELGEGQYFVKLEEKGVRPLDADQLPSVRATAFENWYGQQKEQAETDGWIVRADESGLPDEGEPGTDVGP